MANAMAVRRCIRRWLACGLAALALAGCTVGVAAQDHAESATIGGISRHWLVHLPGGYRAGRPLPLVLAFHGHGGTPSSLARQSGLDAVADRMGFIVVYPEGIDHSWAADVDSPADRAHVDDVAFVGALLDRLQRQYAVDPAHIVLTGFSNGAHLVQLLGCRMAGRLSAIVPVSGTLAVAARPSCRPSRPLTVVAFHGTGDPIDPYAGGAIHVAGGGAVLPVDAALADWARWDGCTGTPVTTREDAGAAIRLERVQWSNCGEGTRVVLYRIIGGGHTWPGGPQYLPAFMVGKATRVVKASEVIGQVATGAWR